MDLIIFGTGVIAEVAYYYFENDSDYRIISFCETEVQSSTMLGLNVISFDKLKEINKQNVEIFVAIGYSRHNRIRQDICGQVEALGFKLASYISSKATILSDRIGKHCFILEDNTIQPYVEIGDNVTLWSGNHIGHHTKIGDNVFVSSQVVVSGRCEIGKNTFIGVNATVADGISIGNFNVIGAAAVANKSTEDRTVIQAPESKIRVIPRDII